MGLKTVISSTTQKVIRHMRNLKILLMLSSLILLPMGADASLKAVSSGGGGVTLPVSVPNGGTGSTTVQTAATTLSNGYPPTLRIPLNLTDDTTFGYAANNLWFYNNQFWLAITTTNAGFADWQIQTSISAPMLDLVSGAQGAYGVFRLRNAYAGFAFQVTRSSDSTTLNIPFGVDGVASWSMVDAFCLGTSCGVSDWYDQSGNGYDLTQATFSSMPEILGGHSGKLRSISFNGVIDGARTLENTALTVSDVSNSSEFIVGRGLQSGNNLGSTMFQLGDPTYKLFAWSDSANNGVKWFCCGSGISLNVGMPAQDQVFYWNVNAGTVSVTQNNKTATSGFSVSSAASTGLRIGSTSIISAPTQYEMLAFVVYQSSLSAANQQLATEALYQATGIQPQMQNVLVLKGDSIMGATTTGATTLTLPMQVALNTQNTVYSYAAPGETLQSVLSTLASYASISKQAGANVQNVFVVFEGTNDLAANDTGANVYGYFQTACTNLHTAGFKCVIASPLPRAGGFTNGQSSNGFETQRQALITLMNAGWTSFADGYIATGSDPIMGLQATASNTAYYVDGIHPTSPLGSSFIAAAFQRGLQPLLQYR